MGMLRFLLAIFVVAQHTMGVLGLSGSQAVEVFFLISGFLMSFVLTEKKSYSRPSLFYKNRFLRLFPTYWIALILTLIFNLWTLIKLGGSGFFQVLGQMNPPLVLFTLVSNVTILGQEGLLFLDLHQGNILLKSQFDHFYTPLHWGLLVPQAWSLSLEISFYLVAPFILKRRWALAAAFAASLALRESQIYSLVPVDPWVYRSFPSELCIFLLGAISHQLTAGLRSRLKNPWAKIVGIFSAVLAVTLAFNSASLPQLLQPNDAGLILGYAFLLPGLFLAQNSFRWDRKLGEYSYPIYIIHLLVFQVLNTTTQYVLKPWQLFICTCALSVVSSYVLFRTIEPYIDRLRNKNRIQE